jgi:hypothetical protein
MGHSKYRQAHMKTDETAGTKGRPRHPARHTSDEMRKAIETMVAVGTPQNDICEIFGLTRRTLNKYFEHEIKTGLARANAAIGGRMYALAMGEHGADVVTRSGTFWHFWSLIKAMKRTDEREKEVKAAAATEAAKRAALNRLMNTAV